MDVTAPLNYSDSNLNPSPVERCISTRLGNYKNLHKQVRAHHRLEDELNRGLDYLIEEHASYFLPSMERWLDETSHSLQEYVYELDCEIMKSWTSFHCERIRHGHKGAESRIKAACSLVRRRMVSQRLVHAPLKDDYWQRDGFFARGLSRGLRGFGNCEGINDLLCRLLKELFPGTKLFQLQDPETGLSHHIVVKVVTEEGGCIADAWSDHAVYYVRELDSTPPGAGIPELGEVGVVNCEGHAQLFPRSFYLAGEALEVEDGSPRAKAGDWEIPTLVSPSGGHDPWRSYLRVRKAHFFGVEDTARGAYRELLAKQRFGGLTREVINAFAKQ